MNNTVGVIGCGSWGRLIIDKLLQLKEYYTISLKGILHTGNVENRRQVTDNSQINFFTDRRKFFKNLDIVFIVSPDETHFEFAREALLNGIHTFVEKPIANSIKQTNQLYELASKKNVKLTTGHILLFHPCFKYVRESLAELGNPPPNLFSSRHGSFSLEGNSSVHYSSLIHDLSMIDAILSNSPQEISVSSFSREGNKSEYENIFLEYSEGISAHLVASAISPVDERIFKAWVRNHFFLFDGAQGYVEVYQSTGDDWEILSRKDLEGDALLDEIDHFLRTVLFDEPLIVDREHVLRVMKTLQKIDRSLS